MQLGKRKKNEKITVGAGTEFPLKGILALPDDLSRPVPAVVMVHGSGASNRDEKVMSLTPFRDLAEGLRQHGIASLRYDKRTFAHARKMAKLDGTVRDETIEDAVAALELLKADPRIDRDNVFLLGHSMGAMLAPRIDAEGGNVKGLIMMAGTPRRMEEIVLRQLKQGQSAKPPLRWIIKHQYRKYERLFTGLYQMSDEEARKKKFAGSISLYYFKEMGRKTAGDYLLESRKPVLIMQGGRDFQVLVQDDFLAFQRILQGKDNVEYKLYPDLNHCFVPAIYDDILKASKDYRIERHIGSDVIGDIAAFIEKNAAGGAETAR